MDVASIVLTKRLRPRNLRNNTTTYLSVRINQLTGNFCFSKKRFLPDNLSRKQPLTERARAWIYANLFPALPSAWPEGRNQFAWLTVINPGICGKFILCKSFPQKTRRNAAWQHFLRALFAEKNPVDRFFFTKRTQSSQRRPQEASSNITKNEILPSY